MKNYVCEGDVFEFTAGGTITAGSPVLMGSIVGIAAKGGVSGEVIPVNVCGVFTVTKATGAAWAVGDALYWDAGNSSFTKTASGNTLAGYAYAAAASGAATGQIKLLL